jgi:hypothetical protein
MISGIVRTVAAVVTETEDQVVEQVPETEGQVVAEEGDSSYYKISN